MGEDLKRMVDLLKAGATMLSEHCPECSSPLFKLNDEIWCSKCNKRVIIIKEGEAVRVQGSMLLKSVEETVLTKIQSVNQQIKNESDPARLQELGNLLSTWLEAMEKLKKIQRA